MTMMNDALESVLLAAAAQDERIWLVAAENDSTVSLKNFLARFPDRTLACGPSAQNAASLAAGLARTGAKPFVYAPSEAMVSQAGDSIAAAAAYSLPIVFIGHSAGVCLGQRLDARKAVQDVARLCPLSSLMVLAPADHYQAAAMARFLCTHNGPAYLRLEEGHSAAVYDAKSPFYPGQANVLTRGRDVSLIAYGGMVHQALDAAAILAREGIQARAIDLHTLSPLDADALLDAAESRCVVVVEEHSVAGGVGSFIAAFYAQRKPTPMRLLGLPGPPLYSGPADAIRQHYGLTAKGIAQAARDALST